MKRTNGFTLLELLVVVAILGVLVGLLLAAVQKMRESAARMSSANNLRQISLGLQHFSTSYDGRIPGVSSATAGSNEESLLSALIPYIDGETRFQLPAGISVVTQEMLAQLWPRRTVFLSPADPSLATYDQAIVVNGTTGEVTNVSLHPPTNYVCNMAGFEGSPRIPSAFADGTSNTLALCERYAMGYRTPGTPTWSKFSYVFGSPAPTGGSFDGYRRPTFADRGWGDVVPVTGSAVTKPSVPGKTFQTRPTPGTADATIPQTPFSGGLVVALFDGSVRTLSPSTSATVFWSAVTPNGAEVSTLD